MVLEEELPKYTGTEVASVTCLPSWRMTHHVGMTFDQCPLIKLGKSFSGLTSTNLALMEAELLKLDAQTLDAIAPTRRRSRARQRRVFQRQRLGR